MDEEVQSSKGTKLDDGHVGDNAVQEIQIADDIGGNVSDTSCLTNAINRQLFLDESTADFHFLFEKNAEVFDEIISVPAHKIILSTGSKVFRTMFYGSLPVGNGEKIVDATVAAFREFLQFFYCDQVALTSENIAKVMYLVKKYGIERCMRQCVEFLKTTMRNDDVCSSLHLALQYELEDLKHFCLRKICGNAEEVLQTEDFANCESNVFNTIVRSDSLMCEEAKVFDACITWAKKSCEKNGLNDDVENLREKLKDSLFFIHFRRMKIEEFAQRNAQYFGLFTAMEVKDIIQIIASKDYKCELFTTNPVTYDIFTWDENRVSDVVFEIDEGYSIRGVEATESLPFSSNKPLLLGKMKFSRIFGNLVFGSRTEMRIIQKSKNETSVKTLFKQTFQLSDRKDVFAKFDKPVFIDAKSSYEIQFNSQNGGFNVVGRFNLLLTAQCCY